MERALPAELVNGMAALARQHGATPFMAWLALYEVLLARYTGETDFAVGTPIAGRTRPDMEPLIGFFREHPGPEIVSGPGRFVYRDPDGDAGGGAGGVRHAGGAV